MYFICVTMLPACLLFVRFMLYLCAPAPAWFGLEFVKSFIEDIFLLFCNKVNCVVTRFEPQGHHVGTGGARLIKPRDWCKQGDQKIIASDNLKKDWEQTGLPAVVRGYFKLHICGTLSAKMDPISYYWSLKGKLSLRKKDNCANSPASRCLSVSRARERGSIRVQWNYITVRKVKWLHLAVHFRL